MSRSLIDIKFASIHCIEVVSRPGTTEELIAQVKKRVGQQNSPYEQEPAILNLSAWPETPNASEIDTIREVVQTLRASKIQLVGIQSSQPAHEALSETLGEYWVDASGTETPSPSDSTTPPDAPVPTPEEPAPVAEPIPEPSVTSSMSVAASPAEPGVTPPKAAETLLIDGPVRSGQKIYARGSDVVVLGQVSPGAEVIADGNIHIYGPLRGRALAGANGNRKARIVATSFAAELVAVAGFYMTFESGYPANTANQATQILLDSEDESASLRIEPINIR